MDWMGLGQIIGGGALMFVPGAQAVGAGLIAGGVGSMASSRANDQLQQANTQAQTDMRNTMQPYLDLGAGSASLLARGLGINMPTPSSGAELPPLSPLANTGQIPAIQGGRAAMAARDGLRPPVPPPAAPIGSIPLSALAAALAQRQSSYAGGRR